MVNIKEEGSFYDECLENEEIPITERPKINSDPWFTLVGEKDSLNLVHGLILR